MKRYKITLMVPQVKEVVVENVQAAHNEATRLAGTGENGTPRAIVKSIEFVGDVQTEPLDFDPAA